MTTSYDSLGRRTSSREAEASTEPGALQMLRNFGLLTVGVPFERRASRRKFAYIGIMDDYVGGNSWVHGTRSYTDLRMLSIFSPTSHLCERLDEFQPEVLVTKPHKLAELACEQQLGHLCIHPDKVIAVGEVLTPRDRLAVENGFGVTPGTSYSTCETGPVAMQVPGVEALDLLEEQVYAESVDERGKPIREYHKYGDLLITTFYNRRMPLLRYNIGDSACYLPGGTGPFSRISYVRGMSTSRFILTDENCTTVQVSEFPFWSFTVNGIARHQVIQQSRTHLLTRIEWEKGFVERQGALDVMERKIRRIFEERGQMANVTLSFEDVTRIEPSRSGKIRITIPLASESSAVDDERVPG